MIFAQECLERASNREIAEGLPRAPKTAARSCNAGVAGLAACGVNTRTRSRRNRLEPSCTDPYARWRGRDRRATAAPVPIKAG